MIFYGKTRKVHDQIREKLVVGQCDRCGGPLSIVCEATPYGGHYISKNNEEFFCYACGGYPEKDEDDHLREDQAS